MSRIIKGEGKQVEFKREYTRSILKTISAFSNYHDGEIIIGIDDDLNIVGVDDPIALKLNLENAINDNIVPRPYYEIEEDKIENKSIVILRVYVGENTPYLYKNKAYKRMNTSTINVQRHDMEALILKGRNQGFDELEYPNDNNLKFDTLNNKLREILNIGIISNDILKTLGLIKNEKYNNAAALLSDKSPIDTGGITLIRFEDNSVNQIRDRLILKNISLLDMFDRSIEFYHKHINKREIIKNAYRKSIEEIPLIAYREAMTNAIVHRNYILEADIRVEIYDNRIEIISPGGLPIGITEAEYLDGRISISRNKIIADVFLRLGIIERLATGIRRIKEYYKDYKNKPQFSILENSITVILPNISTEIDQGERLVNDGERLVNASERLRNLSIDEQKIIRYIEDKGKVTRPEVEKLLNLKKTYAVKSINGLVKKGLVVRVGGGRNTYYTLKE